MLSDAWANAVIAAQSGIAWRSADENPFMTTAERAIGDALNFKLMPEGLSASEAGMRRVFVTLQSAGLVPKDAAFDMADFVDGSYLAAAR